MSLAKFLLKLGLGVTSALFGAIGLGLGLGRVLFWPQTDFMDPGIIASVIGAVLLVAGVWLLLMARGDLQNPDFLKAMIVRAFNRGSWTNTLCPICGWWMRSRDVKFPRESEQLVRAWYCVNPDHAKTWPEGT